MFEGHAQASICLLAPLVAHLITHKNWTARIIQNLQVISMSNGLLIGDHYGKVGCAVDGRVGKG